MTKISKEEYARMVRTYRRRFRLYQELGWVERNPYFHNLGNIPENKGPIGGRIPAGRNQGPKGLRDRLGDR